MAADPRRSSRTTKGVNPRLEALTAPSPTPTPSRRRAPPKTPSTTKKSPNPAPSPSRSPTPSDDIIRCVCGAKEEDEDDGRMMIQCEGCDAWQHTACMGIKKKDIPEKYYCEVCRPEEHRELVEAMGRGERPWEKGRRRKTTKGRGRGRGGTVDSEATKADDKKDEANKEEEKSPEKEEPKANARSRRKKITEEKKEEQEEEDKEEEEKQEEEKQQGSEKPEENGEEQPAQENGDTEMTDAPPPETSAPPESEPEGEKEKVALKNGRTISPIDTASASASPGPKSKEKKEKRESRRDPAPKTPKRKLSTADGSDEEYQAESPKEPDKKSRRTSVASTPADAGRQTGERRRSSVASTAPPKAGRKPSIQQTKSEDNSFQPEEVEKTEELRNTSRQRTVQYLVQNMLEHCRRMAKDGTVKLEEGVTAEQLCEKRGLKVEHKLYMKLCPDGEIVGDYRQRARSIGYNLKSNPALSEEFLTGRLEAERLATMTAEEMASKELKELTQKVRLESEKQHTLLNETQGPRIRRTHKGEELVIETEEMDPNEQDTLLESGSVIRRSDTDRTDGHTPVSAHSTHHSPRSPSAMNVDADHPTPQRTRSPSRHSSVPAESKTPKTPSFNISSVWSHVETPAASDTPRPSISSQHRPSVAQQQDKDIDALLRDDDAGTPPYSPRSDLSPPPPDNAWRGQITMVNIASLSATATLLGGPAEVNNTPWHTLVDPVLTIDGRIKHDRATEYLCGQKFSRSSTLVLAQIRPDTTRSKTGEQDFAKLYEYFRTKERYAVVAGQKSRAIKDLYIVPVDIDDARPDWWYVVQPQNPAMERATGKILVLVFVLIRGLVGAERTPAPPPQQQIQYQPPPAFPPPPPPPQHHLPYNPHQPLLPFARYEPKHPMTKELINMVPGLGDLQIRAIDTLLQENPELQTKPDVLAKEVEKVLGAGGGV